MNNQNTTRHRVTSSVPYETMMLQAGVQQLPMLLLGKGFTKRVREPIMAISRLCPHSFVSTRANRMSRDSSVGIATGYGLDDRGVKSSSPGRDKNFLFSRCPDRPWGSPNLLFNVYWGGRGVAFPGGKAASA
jgi:hypothetical protein